MSSRILVVGNVCVDTSINVPYFPRVGETLTAVSSRDALGGKGLNQAVAAARFGADVAFLSIVGQREGPLLRQYLANEGIMDVVEEVGEPTDRSLIVVAPGGENAIVSEDAAFRSHILRHPGLDKLDGYDLMLLQGNGGYEVARGIIERGAEAGLVPIMNAAPVDAEIVNLLPRLEGLVVNAVEARVLGGVGDPMAVLQRLSKLGPKWIIVTQGAAGALWWCREDPEFRVSDAAVSDDGLVVDTSGAGDVFTGVLVGSLVGNIHLGQAIQSATRIATASVRLGGALASVPTTEVMQSLDTKVHPSNP